MPQTGAPHQARDAYELALARTAYEQRVPTLAICRGAQVMNVALGGTLVQDIAVAAAAARSNTIASDRRTERVHEVAIDRRSRLADIVGTTRSPRTRRTISRSIASATGCTSSAKSPDGIVEAPKPTIRAWWMVAVQWHPEELTATVGGLGSPAVRRVRRGSARRGSRLTRRRSTRL